MKYQHGTKPSSIIGLYFLLQEDVMRKNEGLVFQESIFKWILTSFMSYVDVGA